MRSPGLFALGALLACGAAACGDDRAPAAPSAPRAEVLTFTLDGVERTVMVHAPAGGEKLPLVLDLHPSGSTAASQREATKLLALADREGFAVAHPQAAIAHDSGYQWHVPGSPLVGGQPEPAGPDDVAFIAEAIERIDRALGGRVDRSRIFATGFSGGARMSSSLGCALPQLRAIAPIGGVRAPEPCPRSGLSVIAFHGTEDKVNAYDGPAGAYWTYGVGEAMRRWAERGGCAAEPEVTRAGATVELRRYSGCADGTAVQLYSLEGEAHELPRAIFAGELMWRAFSAL